MTFLPDTNVVSEIRKKAPDTGVSVWFASVPASQLFLSVLVVGEIRQGIERLVRRDPARAEIYEQWLYRLVNAYGDRIVPDHGPSGRGVGTRECPRSHAGR